MQQKQRRRQMLSEGNRNRVTLPIPIETVEAQGMRTRKQRISVRKLVRGRKQRGQKVRLVSTGDPTKVGKRKERMEHGVEEDPVMVKETWVCGILTNRELEDGILYRPGVVVLRHPAEQEMVRREAVRCGIPTVGYTSWMKPRDKTRAERLTYERKVPITTFHGSIFLARRRKKVRNEANTTKV